MRNRPRLYYLLASIFTAVLLKSGSCLAMPDGQKGPTSTGYEGVTLDIPYLIKISNMSDAVFGTYSGSTDTLSYNNRVCIYTNHTQNYKVTASGDRGADGEIGTGFFLHQGTFVLPYSVKWNAASSDGGTDLTAGVTLNGVSGANTTSQNCANGNNANFEVLLKRTDILDVPAGNYSGVLKFIVRAE